MSDTGGAIGGGGLEDRFAAHFYSRLPADELAGRSGAELRAAALAMLAFMRRRAAGADKLRVYDPDPETDGWRSPHTAIDVVTDDRPFIVDSLISELGRRDIPIRFVAHPIFRVERDAAGGLVDLRARGGEGGAAGAESVVRIEIGRGAADSAALQARLAAILRDVRNATDDWEAMRAVLEQAITEAARGAPGGGELEEGLAFLRWLADRNFTFLGYRRYDIAVDNGAARLRPVPGSALGVLRRAAEPRARGPALPESVMRRLRDARPATVSKSARRSTVHRAAHMDSVEVKRRDAEGRAVGIHRFLGLYTSAAYNASPAETPLLRGKISAVLRRAGFPPASHDAKALVHVFDTFPRDELFLYEEDALLETGLGIMRLHERPRPRLFVRAEGLGRAVSCLVFIPRDHFDARLRARIARILETAFGGACEAFFTSVGDDPLARLHVIVRTPPGGAPPYSAEAIEARIAAAARSWEDDLAAALAAAHDGARAATLRRRYASAFPPSYRNRFAARMAVDDIERVEEARGGGGLALALSSPHDSADGPARFKIYSRGEQLALSDILPTLENMGLRVADEFPYRLAGVAGGGDVWIHDLGVHDRSGAEIDIAASGARLAEAFARVWSGEAEDDGFNALVLRAGLGWREAAALRAYAKYLRQVRIPFSEAYMARTLADNPDIARRLVDLFAARLDPARKGDRAGAAGAAAIRAALDSVESLDQDRIVRRFVNAIEATLRTNFYRRGPGGAPRAELALKIDSARITDLPAPRPAVEIFVYGARVEGVHLRGGKVARGGVRWSGRPEDFRTEILGLMKAQMVKNAVIVPVGAKGGFTVKRPRRRGGGGEAADEAAEARARYRAFVSALLDVTDNLAGGRVAPPPDTVRHDGDDPYLVVAADRGTATFSDDANAVAAEYGFWLGDAFASGGSSGYDHKRMGITARGAWEAVKRHFREMDRDTQSEDFTVVGVGDMSGDVFGNGMLLSHRIRLIGAFDHRHIFIDPDADAETGFAERRRLFALPRSSWADYDPAAISAGGGVFDRRAKSIALTPEIRRALDTGAAALAPNDLIAALLRAPVDLLWNGGIGTYVKASGESHADAGDRANDATRIDAPELRCKVVGEGGNLGLTQRARVEAARNGVRLNADAIDNSAGVDCSDREVNIKILLGEAERAGELTRAGRDALLREMTDAVAERCIADNYLQTLGIGAIEALGAERLDLQQRLMHAFERDGRLDRAAEALPDDEAIEARRAAGEGLSRPEIAALYAHAKTALYDSLLASDLPDDPFFRGDLERYFPAAAVERFGHMLSRHRLRREIVATVVANGLIDRASMAFALMAQEETGRGAADVARAWAVARDAFDLPAHWAGVESLDGRAPWTLQNELIQALRGLMEHSTLWFLRNRPHPLDCRATVALFGDGARALIAGLESILPGDMRAEVAARAAALIERGAPAPQARMAAAAGPLCSACCIVEAAERAGAPVLKTGGAFFDVGQRLGLDWLRNRARGLAPAGLWQRQAASAIVEDLYDRQTELTARIIESAGGAEGWAVENAAALAGHARLLDDLRAQPRFDLAMLAAASRRVRDLVRR